MDKKERTKVLVEGTIQHLSGAIRKKFKDRWVQVIEIYRDLDSSDLELCPNMVQMNIMK